MAQQSAHDYQGYLKVGTKECLEHFKGCPQLKCALMRGISRTHKHDQRVKKRTQHEQNVLNRAYVKGKK